MSEEHGSLIKTPKQLIVTVFAVFFIPLIIILLLIIYDTSHTGSSALNLATSNALIQPIAKLDFKDSSAPQVLKTGEEVYKSVCSACHAAGVAGAPAFANNGAWSARVGKGYEALLSSVVKGKGAMPARGGAAPDDVNELELGRSVVYLVNASGGKLAEPKEATVEKK